jgi:hypothetical protein
MSALVLFACPGRKVGCGRVAGAGMIVVVVHELLYA